MAHIPSRKPRPIHFHAPAKSHHFKQFAHLMLRSERIDRLGSLKIAGRVGFGELRHEQVQNAQDFYSHILLSALPLE